VWAPRDAGSESIRDALREGGDALAHLGDRGGAGELGGLDRVADACRHEVGLRAGVAHEGVRRGRRGAHGAALSARDNVVGTVEELRTTYGTRAKTERQLRKAQRSLETDLRRFERRGTTARNQLEREVKRARTRVERQMREQRKSLRGAVRTTPPAPDTLVRNAKAQADFVSARVGNAVETAQLAGATAVAKVSERVASLA
jgi:hypothetical protein